MSLNQGKVRTPTDCGLEGGDSDFGASPLDEFMRTRTELSGPSTECHPGRNAAPASAEDTVSPPITDDGSGRLTYWKRKRRRKTGATRTPDEKVDSSGRASGSRAQG
ncbi:unnamed protein product [Macrosiphum euphorbiae]|uniref:Uncharacterized protein n=1 Tax=Macrosiphum euphorbiae TaxID=13131 RepID=A0AAV0XRJ8_9HEMI|nr:unnamed protein product [Macrosiphum euphorbiae]